MIEVIILKVTSIIFVLVTSTNYIQLLNSCSKLEMFVSVINNAVLNFDGKLNRFNVIIVISAIII